MAELFSNGILHPAGERAATFEVGRGIDPGIHQHVRSVQLGLEKRSVRGINEILPTYCTLFIEYDPMLLSFSTLEMVLRDVESGLEGVLEVPKRIVEIPTCYGGEHGPDLEFVAENAGLGIAEVIALHAGTDYLVYMMGFTPGFTYLGGLNESIATPRLETPRVIIPAGSVGIAGSQTGIYPSDGPGGWRLIGKTPVSLFDPAKRPPTLLEPGHYLRFIPISIEEYAAISDDIKQGRYKVTELSA